MALKHQEYGHTFYRETPNLCIIYKMRNGCLCWLVLVTVDIIRDWLPQVTKLSFVRVLNCVAALHQALCFDNHMANTIICGPFDGFNAKRPFRMNLVHGNTDNTSYIHILTWPGMTSSLTSHGSVNVITQYLIQNCLTWNIDGKF